MSETRSSNEGAIILFHPERADPVDVVARILEDQLAKMTPRQRARARRRLRAIASKTEPSK